MTETTKQKIDAYKQQLLEELVEQCTLEQRAFFWRMYPDGPNEEQYDWACQQCERTIAQNGVTDA